MTEVDVDLLAEKLRRSVGGFVRAIRQQTNTVRSAQSETLDMLDRQGPQNVASLAQQRGVTHQTMRLVVAGLEAASLINQAADPADRRSRLISLSRQGREALAQERERRTEWIADVLRRRLSASERDQLHAAVALLDRLSTPALQPNPITPDGD
jgi:DNA-binding MarR family transcriptional regulator